MTKIVIGVAHHKEGRFVRNEIIEPIQVGSLYSDSHWGITRDDSHDNISHLNPYCCELSATYWLWKNVNADYYGLFHYRRFMTFKPLPVKNRILSFIPYVGSKILAPFVKDARYSKFPEIVIGEDDVEKYLMTFSDELKERLTHDDVRLITLKPVKASTRANRTKLSIAIGQNHVRKIESIISESFPSYEKYFKATMFSSSYYPANMFVMDRQMMNEYCSFLFDVLRKYHEWLGIDLEYNEGNKPVPALLRISGYVGEMLTDTFVRKIEAEGTRTLHLNCATVAINGSSLSSVRQNFIQRLYTVLCKRSN